MFGPLNRLYERSSALSTALVERLLAPGLATLLWPPALGAALAVVTLEIWPRFSKAVHAKYGGAFIVVIGALLTLGLTWLVARRLRGPVPMLRVVTQLRRFGSPLLLVPLMVTVSRGLEQSHPFMVLGVALVVAWVVAHWMRAWLRPDADDPTPASGAAERIIGPLSAASPWTKHWPKFALAIMVASYTVVFSRLSINNHLAFNTSRADLGFYVSIFRRSSLGDLLGCTICGGGNHLSGHFDPILVVLSPLYLLYPEAETVLVLQSLLLGVTMVPLYMLARHHGVSTLASLLLCLCYGLHPALHGVNLFDFHSLALLIPSAVWLLWARDTERTKTYWAFLLVTLLVREDAALVAVVIGLDTLLSRRKGSALQGLLTIAIGASYFLFVKAALMGSADPLQPRGIRGYAYYYKDLVPKDSGTMGLVTSVLSEPDKVLVAIAQEEKVLYWLQLLTPLLALPLLAQRGRLLLGYGAAFTLLASREHVYSLHFHYSAVVLPFLFYLSVTALAEPQGTSRFLAPLLGRGRLSTRRLQLLLVTAALAATVITSWRFGGIVPNRTFRAGFRALDRSPTAEDIRRDQSLKDICRTVPDGAIVASNEPNLPHMGRCSGYQVKKRRLTADYLVWSKSRTTPTAKKNPATRAVQREIEKGYWKSVGVFGAFELFKNVAPKDARKSEKGAKRPATEDRKPRRIVSPKTRVAKPAQSESDDVLDGGTHGSE
jgi:uncharacterized membrane protein